MLNWPTKKLGEIAEMCNINILISIFSRKM